MSAGLLERNRRLEYGDFQTPADLADAVCRVLRSERPATLIEPTCGTGAFLAAGLSAFPCLRFALAMDINQHYAASARRIAARTQTAARCRVRVGDFFRTDWRDALAEYPEPLLLLGNPPWVTNSVQGVLRGGNLPPKQNLAGRSGLEGLTGKSNFDVSEWMIYRLLEAMAGRRATLAMLCKTAVARRVLARAWQTNLLLHSCEIRAIDAAQHFGARVEACLLICRCSEGPAPIPDCRAFYGLESRQRTATFGWRDGRLVANVAAYERVRHLLGGQARWRSGIKHDCAAVFEFREENGRLINGLGEAVDLEDHYLYPLVKSSDVAAMRGHSGTLSHSDGRGQGEGSFFEIKRRLLVTQERVGQETESIARRAPKTWRYLEQHVEQIDRRASRVYRGQPRFSIFGVGPYTFTPWKVVVSGFYKAPRFVALGPVRGRPVVCDDTCYFLPCRNRAEARNLASQFNGPLARDFFSAFIFRDAKRPLTTEILNSLDLTALALERGA